MELTQQNLSEFIDKATALKSIEDALGEFYKDQKAELLSQFTDTAATSGAPMTELVKILKGMMEIKFIDAKELALFTSKLLSKAKKLKLIPSFFFLVPLRPNSIPSPPKHRIHF